MGRIHHVFITHMHGDHIFGLFGLISSFNLLFRKEDLHIYAPDGLQQMLDQHLNIFEPYLQYKIVFHTLTPNEKCLIYEDKHLQVFSFPLFHKVPAFGYLFQEKAYEPNLRKALIKQLNVPVNALKGIKAGDDWITDSGQCIPNKQLVIPPYRARSFAYCSDTLYAPSITRYFKNVDVLFHEATFANDCKKQARQTMHSTAAQAAQIAEKAQAGKLLMGHFSARYKKITEHLNEARAIFPNSYATRDGQQFDIPLERERE